MLEPSLPGGVSFGEGSVALRKFLARELQPGEAVIWQGRPGLLKVPRVLPVMRGIGMAFALCWLAGVVALGGAGIIGEMRAGHWEVAAAFAAFTLIMFGAGLAFLYMVKRFGAFLTDQHYLLTTQRVLLIMRLPLGGYRALSLTPHDPARVQRTETNPDGSGTLVFRPLKEASSETKFVPGFYHVPQVDVVERLIREMIARHGVRP